MTVVFSAEFATRPAPSNMNCSVLGVVDVPIWKNKLIYFGDIETKHLDQQSDADQRADNLSEHGNFSELLNGDTSGVGVPTLLCQPLRRSGSIGSPIPVKPDVIGRHGGKDLPAHLEQIG